VNAECELNSKGYTRIKGKKRLQAEIMKSVHERHKHFTFRELVKEAK
jgi:hypothetical protein